jgi:hypothetical protein
VDAKPFGLGLLRRRELVVPTWRGLSAMALIIVALAWVLRAGVHPFLAVNAPVGGEALVVEGWIPDYALREALLAFRSRPYKMVIATGGPVPQGMAFSYHGNYARLAAASLLEFGLSPDSLAEVPSPEVDKDRTYAEGLSLKAWMEGRGSRFPAVDVFSFSTHARRSRLLYAMALGPGTRVGVYAPRDAQYDSGHWWRTSNGVRRVTDEVIAYLYAKLIFRD